MDLSKLRPMETPVAIDIVHPVTGEELDISISIHGTDSTAYKTAMMDVQNRRLQTTIGARQNVKLKLSAKDMEQDALNVLAACTESWSGVAWEGKELPCTADNARMIYANLPWLREQVESKMGDRENFMPTSLSN